jgi:hypothetical protein
MSVVVPAGITGPDTLRINGLLGAAASTQLFDSYITHPSPGYLSTFDGNGAGDNTGFVNWTGGYQAAPATQYPNATGAVAFLTNGSSMAGYTGPGSQGNPGFVQLNDVPWVASTSTAIAGYSLKFEVYTTMPWTAGEIWIMMGDWYAWHNYMARYAPWTTAAKGVFQPSEWTTVTIPLSQMLTVTGTGVTVKGSANSDNNEWDYGAFPQGGVPAVHFSDYEATSLCFTIVNDQASPSVSANGMNVAIDNVRIVWGQ